MLYASVMTIWDSFSTEQKFYIGLAIGFVVLTILGVVASVRVNSIFAKYANVQASCGLTAEQIASRMLADNDCAGVKIQRIGGNLTDNYNPVSKTLSLSQSVYGSSGISAIGVACHEAGHAAQDAAGFFFARLRLKLVPVVNFANSALFPILLIGMILGLASPYTTIGRIFIWAGVIIFGLSLLFSLVTLPTEFDASRRAQRALKDGYFSGEEAAMSRKVLTAAAMTYVVSFLMSLLQFLRFFGLILLARRRD